MRPLGYWVKHVDTALEGLLDGALAGEGVTRRQWQVLNTLATTGLEPAAALAPFLTPEAPTLGPETAALTARGWLDAAGSPTAAGRRAHARLAEEVGRLRRQAVEGLSAEDYRTLVGLLERVARNLPLAATAPPAR